jgi:hypothetical protein
MFGHLLVNPVEHRFIATGMNDRGLGIIRIMFPPALCGQQIWYG